jgi:Cu+-exporting ATPase
MLAQAAGLEMHAAHPLASAIVEYAKSFSVAPLALETVSTHEGLGVYAQHNGNEICAGSLRFFQQRNFIIPHTIAELSAGIEKNGKTAVLMAKNGCAYGVFGISDAVKDTAKDAIAMLKAMNRSVMMITGDNLRAASAIASSLEIQNVIAEVLPHDKSKEIQKLQQQGKTVAFVGDGINDAPALAQADIGIAVAGGTDIALEAGSVVLLNGDLRDVASALSLGEKVTSRIRQNIFWAFAYNIILIPVAAGALYPLWGVSLRPELAGLAMALSSVTVVTLSLALMRYNPRKKIIPFESFEGKR